MLAGGDGEDVLVSGRGNDSDVDGDAGDDIVIGGLGNDELRGGDGNDVIDAGPGSDHVDGGRGNDVISGGEGADVLLGGEGDDLIWIARIKASVDCGPGNDVVYTPYYGYQPSAPPQGADVARYVGCELVVVKNPMSGASLWIDPATVVDTARNAGLEQAPADARAVIRAVRDAETSVGSTRKRFPTSSADNLSVAELRKLRGVGPVYALAGDDHVEGSGDGDYLDGGDGVDRLEGRGGDDTLIGGAGDDRLEGARGKDLLTGNAGDDRLNGGQGRDTLEGGSGDDTLVSVDGEKDTVRCGPGHDTVKADRFDAVAKDCERA